MTHKNTKKILYDINNTSLKSIFLIIISCIIGFPSFSQDIPANSDCEICASIHSYPQLASLNTDDGLLSQLIFNQLLGTDIDLTTLNWQGITQSDFQIEKFMLTLAEDLDISSTHAVLEQDLTFNQIITALATVADNQGTVAALNSILNAQATTGTIKLKDFLTIDTFEESLSDISIDFFSFLNTAIQIYNYKNVLVTNDPLDVSIPIIGEISLQAQVVEPPNIICSKSEMQLFSAGVRLKMDIDIINVTQSSSVVVNLTNIGLDLSLTDMELYADVARGLTTINQVDGPGSKINIDAEPGLARLYLGSIDESDFFDRTKDPIDYINPGRIGDLKVILPILPDVSLDVNAIGSADAVSVLQNVDDLTLPFDINIGNSSSTISELIDELLTNTTISITSTIPLTALLNDVLAVAQEDIINTTSSLLFAEDGIVHDELVMFVDPILKSLGIATGELILKGNELIETCFDFGDAPNVYGTLIIDNGPMHAIDPNIHLGEISPESDADGVPHAQADFDTGDDGLINYPETIDPTTFSIDVNVTNTSLDSAQLIGWVDFNDNGIFEDNFEKSIITNGGNVDTYFTGIVTLNWENLPAGTDPDLKFARFRVSSDPIFLDPATASPNGFLTNGEVEDYLINQAALPVDLLRFEVADQGNKVSISWETINEIDLAEYQVEKSLDGVNFETIYNLPVSNQTDNRVKNYQHNDFDNFTGNVYYRLKSVDLDGQYSLSEIRNVKRLSNDSVTLYPNPCSDKFQITISKSNDGEKLIQLYNTNHQLIYSTTIQANVTYQEIDMSNFPNGIYYVTINNNKQVTSDMIVKQ